jgi:hypothetical protein
MKDPRNQYVNFNLKYKDARLNKVKTHYKTTYNRSYSPKRSISPKNHKNIKQENINKISQEEAISQVIHKQSQERKRSELPVPPQLCGP